MLFVLQDSGASSDTETEHLLSPVRVRRPPRMSLFRRYVTASILSSREPAGEWQECVHRCICCSYDVGEQAGAGVTPAEAVL